MTSQITRLSAPTLCMNNIIMKRLFLSLGFAMGFVAPHATSLLCRMEDSQLSRRALGLRGFKSMAAAGAALLSSKTAVAEDSVAPRVLVLTGASSGIGRDAAEKLVRAGHEVHVACRTVAKAEEAARATGAAKAWVCDLADLDSVRRFSKEWGSKSIDVLCLNAGLAPGKGPIKRTSQGFEECVGTNHLGHFLLAHLLLQRVEKSTGAEPPRVVVTASGVHDPDSAGGGVGSKASLGDLKGLQAAVENAGQFDMVDGGEYDYDKAYKDSKLCNVLFTRELARRLADKKSSIVASCFSPGLIPSTGLFRNQNQIFASVFGFAAKNVLGIAATVGQGGDDLVNMAAGNGGSAANAGLFLATEQGKPGSPFVPQPVSVEAQEGSKAKTLWDLSAKLVGLKEKDLYV
jgi:protochlorophyllide reductase